MEKLSLVQKISAAKAEIKETKLKKEGRNKFSNYDYFTPQQIEHLVTKACANNRMLTKFDLIRDTLGVYGRLTIFDLDSDSTLSYDMATAIPDIKATNIAQQLGGCVTYTERYLKMSAFGITDSNLDFDNDGGSDKKKTKDEVKPEEEKIVAWQVIKIETLLQGSSIDEEEKGRIERTMNGYTFEKANKCIDYLTESQVDRIEAGLGHSLTDVNNKVRAKLNDERA